MINSVVSISLMFFEILAAELLFSHYLHKRKRFALLLAVSIGVCLEVIVLVTLIYGEATNGIFIYGSGSGGVGDSVFKFAYYLLVFALTVGCVMICYGDPPWNVLFYCSGGYAMQHLGFNAANMIKTSAGIDSLLPSYLIEIAALAAIYAVCRILLVKLRIDASGAKSVKAKTLVCLAVLFVCIGLSRITIDDSTRSVLAFYAESAYAVISCLLILGILFSISQKDKALSAAAMMEEVLRREKEQYRISKENIDIINIKCHDLKHQISALRGNVAEEYLKEIEDAVMIYGAAVKTGDDILDVLLTEKSLLCEKEHICLTCVVRGEDLAFMNKSDIYSLFGNALSNAIEHVRRITDDERRQITIASKRTGGLLSVHIENYLDGEPEFRDGLPVTGGDRNYHGFGMQSMKHIAEKYDGCMSVSVEDERFKLDFIFPLPSA